MKTLAPFQSAPGQAGTVTIVSIIGRLLTVIFAICFLLSVGATMAFADAPALFRQLSSDKLRNIKPLQTQHLNRIKQRATTKSVNLVAIDANALQGSKARLVLPNAKTLDFDKTNVESRGAADFTWFGSLSGVPGKATLVVRDGKITGSIRDEGRLYRIEPVGDGLHGIVEVDENHFPKDHPPTFVEKDKRGDLVRKEALRVLTPAVLANKATALLPVWVDVLVAYTPAARDAVADIAATIQLAVAEANQSYVNSGVNIKLNLVDSFEVTYSESGKNYDTILADLAHNTLINNRRNSTGADIAVTLINQPDYCGMADAIMATADTAYAVVHYDCATGYYSFAHEIGHLQGARHDPANDSSSTPFTYGHGLQHTTAPVWRTIMSYNCSGGGCPRLQYWSNPSVSYSGVSMGTAGTNDNARVLNETAITVAAFRSRPGTSDGNSIWEYTGTPCSGNSCPGWKKLDNNPATVRIAAGGTKLYQLHNNGKIWESTGAACSGNSCPGWKLIDNNPASVEITTDGTNLYQLHKTGKIWKYTGVACSGNSCPGWTMIDNNPATMSITADNGQLYQLHNTGKIWQFTGTVCSGSSCPGWRMLDNNSATVAITAGGGKLYQLHNTGKVWRYTGTACSGNSCPGWQMLDNNPATVAIEAGTQLYQLHNSGKVWNFTGTACSGNSCPGWQMLDNNPATIAIYADGGQLYQLHNSGKAWKSTGVACSGNSCPGWQMLDNNPKTGRLSAGGGKLYQLHIERTPMTRVRACYECR